MDPEYSHDLRALLGDFIEGQSVKRARLELRWQGRDATSEFIAVLREHGYAPTTVRDVDIVQGERVPAFLIADGHAYFGWIFWEKFSNRRFRKLFGSVVKNVKGDWAFQIPPSMQATLYANRALSGEMDIDNPSGF
jgi:hypothetical protein